MTVNDYNYIYRTDGCIYRVVDNETIILSMDGKYLHCLNEVGSEIWLKANGTLTLNEIINHICAEFDIDNETAKKDTLDFIQTLLQKKLLVIK